MRHLLFVSLLVVLTVPQVKADDCQRYVQEGFNDAENGISMYGYKRSFQNHHRPAICRIEYAAGWNQALEYYKTQPAPRSYAAPSYTGPIYEYERSYEPRSYGDIDSRGLNATIRRQQQEVRERQMLDALQSIDSELTRQRYGY